MKKNRNKLRIHRKRRIRKRVSGTSKRPRLCVFRSNRIIYAQLIDDIKGVTLAEIDSRQSEKNGFSVDGAEEVGKIIAKKAKQLKLNKVVFDRGGYKYHGKVKALAEGAHKGGLQF
ncbi:MAG: 50S ribosomal protein L18 [Patescibacteria group bacterium]|nr:50S ribosomal protein L18 [Patescibacteria group bacterium]